MASPEVMALVTDALRGQLQSVLPPGATVVVGAPSADAPAAEGLFVHPLRLAISTVRRNEGLAQRSEGGRLRATLYLELDYLVAGLGGETLADLALLDAALQWVESSPMRTHDAMGEGLSQPARWAALASGSLSVHWLLRDMPLDQMAAVWAATGMRQRAGLFLRAEVSWREGEPAPAPITHRPGS